MPQTIEFKIRVTFDPADPKVMNTTIDGAPEQFPFLVLRALELAGNIVKGRFIQQEITSAPNIVVAPAGALPPDGLWRGK